MKRAALGSSVLGLLLLLLVPAALLIAPAASAHTELILSTPADGAVLADAPAEVVLTFSEDLLPDAVQVSVQDAAGVVVIVGDPRVDGSDVIATWPPGVVGPGFTVNYRVVSADGHPVTGSIGFTVADGSTSASAAAVTSVPAPSTSVGDATEPAPSRAPLLAIGTGLAVGIGAGILLVLRARRGSTS